MQFGAHLPLISFSGEPPTLDHLAALTREARDLGYRVVCANDHLIFSRPWLDGLTALAAVLGPSGDMELMTTVVLPTVRGPAATAKGLAAIDLLSNGRLTVGVGPGSSARDYELVGIPFEDRWTRLDDAIGALRAFWSGDLSYEGPHYRTQGMELLPRPVQVPGPPLWIGSWGSAAGLRRVARLGDGWLASGYNTTPELFARARHDLDAQLRRADKDPERFPNGIATMWLYVTDDRRAAELVLHDLLAPMLNRPIDELREKLLVGPAEACAEKLRSYAQGGAERVFVWPVRDEIRQLERFREQVWPLVSPA